MIARGDTTAADLQLALDHGVTPTLAFYAGWPRAMAAVAVARHVLATPIADAATLLPLDEAAEAQRASRVQDNFGATAPALVKYTADVLFRELWLRPGLAPRDRSLVTVSALIATGQSAQLRYHLNRAMDHGLTPTQAAGALTQLAFVCGWPSVFTSLPVVKDTLDKRSHPI